ncbi:mitochondrial GTPase [Niveomyces insectorum RCEF 264]|uniref:Mitochondrial GTPase n=1 Tax=Niveomyces insectorum RCEF 264 TaxID=1081102 RepID=A0A167VCD2_9HYPO|nr:mitochondrial GTPase [Niveomyces insectorum RCEF 264]
MAPTRAGAAAVRVAVVQGDRAGLVCMAGRMAAQMPAPGWTRLLSTSQPVFFPLSPSPSPSPSPSLDDKPCESCPEDATDASLPFTPRTVYEPSTGVPRSYFIGHHRAALDHMRRVLATVGLVIECRDLRVPLTAWNPLLEASLMGTGVATENEDDGGRGNRGSTANVAHSMSLRGLSGPLRATPTSGTLPSTSTGRSRIIVYTKRDLVVDEGAPQPGAPPSLSPTPADLRRLAAFHHDNADAVLFMGAGSDEESKSSPSSSTGLRETTKLLAAVRAALVRGGLPDHAAAAQHLVHAWRRGALGRFCLDALDAEALAQARAAAQQGPPLSLNQARKQEKAQRKARATAKRSGTAVADLGSAGGEGSGAAG